ncbi:hypothetical protein Hdeb2414_s0018g00518371 [Helianthus debilis subsp. tardiflorus]
MGNGLMVQRIKSAELGIVDEEQDNELPNFPSFIPFLPPLSSANLKQYYATCFSLISGIIIFGGLLAPTIEKVNLVIKELVEEKDEEEEKLN